MHVLLQQYTTSDYHDDPCQVKKKKKCKLFQHIPYNTNQQPISSVLTGFSSLSMFFSLWPGGLEARHQIAKENSKEGKCG